MTLAITYFDNDDAGEAHAITFDVTTIEGHTSSVTVTENEVERGAPVVDHIRQAPKTLTLEVIVSNTPITVPPDMMNGITGAVRALDVGKGIQAQVLQFSGDVDRARLTHEELIRISDSGILVTVPTKWRTYENMALRVVSAERTVEHANVLRAKLDFAQVRTVEVTTAPEPVIPHARGRGTRGTQNAHPADPAPSAPRQSTLSRLTGLGRAIH